jgi:hypothetical protein
MMEISAMSPNTINAMKKYHIFVQYFAKNHKFKFAKANHSPK